jgi:hypothetical protein
MALTEVSSGDAGDESGGDIVPEEAAHHADGVARPTAVCVHTGPVCVTIIDWTPYSPPANGVCRCGACHGSYQADSASWFY